MNEPSYHVMLVEDSTTQAISLTALLEGEGWKVTWVSSAEKAFSALRDHRPDLVLLDYHLPGIRGDEVCRRIRMNVDTRQLPLVMLTSQEGQQVSGLDSGADDFVAKSTDPKVLLVRLRTLLQKVGSRERIIAGDQDLFRDVHLLAIDDSPIFLQRLAHELESEGYKIETTVNAEAGLKRLEETNFDGVIIDLIMPRIDGFEVCRRVNELRRHSPFSLISILLTGADSTENLSKALDAGADDFVGKSNDFSILKGRIRALLRRKFFAEENARILQEFKAKELEALRERTAKEAAESRAALVEELEARTEELNRSREELRRASAAKDQFLAMLSHELRTPLTPVLAIVEERCQDECLSDDLKKDFQMIRRNVMLETHLINDLLDLTRITQGKLEIHQERVNLSRIVSEVVEMCTSTRRAHARITVQPFQGDSTILGDRVRLAQVVWNLLQNAVKFTPAEGHIELRLELNTDAESQPKLILEVADTGIGIEPDEIGRIFDAFQQESRETTRAFGGLGLGLAISRAIVELHHGQLTAESGGINQGSTFRLELPPAALFPAANPTSTQDTPGDPAVQNTATDRSSSLTILLVEDHSDTREALARMLRRRGHEVHLATSVAAAQELASSLPQLHVLISDFGLPDGDGLEVLRTIRPNHPSLNAIVLSGFGMEEDIEKTRAAGFAHHLTKPVEFARLEQAIHSLRQIEMPS